MNVLLMVNHSPWGSTLPATAQRCASALLDAGHTLAGIYFRGDGVYNALAGDVDDPGAVNLVAAWKETATAAGCELLLCSSACARRLPGDRVDGLGPPYRVIGLGELFAVADAADRWVAL